MEVAKFFEELLIVVVVFRRRAEESQAITSLKDVLTRFPSRPEIFVYDNSSAAGNEDPSMTYVHDPSNAGVSKAYNQASAFASAKNKKWMLLLDQDTSVVASLFEAWGAALLKHPRSVAFVPVMKDAKGTVSPFALVMGGGKRIRVEREMFQLSRYRFINSGLFIECEAFATAGGYDEEFPLDFSDISFGYRLSHVTDHFIVIDSTLDHHLSSTGRPPLSEALERFGYFCRGARSIGKRWGPRYVYVVRAFLRAVQLTLRYREISFISIFFHTANG